MDEQSKVLTIYSYGNNIKFTDKEEACKFEKECLLSIEKSRLWLFENYNNFFGNNPHFFPPSVDHPFIRDNKKLCIDCKIGCEYQGDIFEILIWVQEYFENNIKPVISVSGFQIDDLDEKSKEVKYETNITGFLIIFIYHLYKLEIGHHTTT